MWIAILMWLVLYSSDFLLTMASAHLYKQRARRHFSLGGSYELNPVFKGDVDARRWLSPRFLVLLAAYSVAIAFTWVLSSYKDRQLTKG